MENEDYAVQETPNRKGRDWNSKNFQVLVYGGKVYIDGVR